MCVPSLSQNTCTMSAERGSSDRVPSASEYILVLHLWATVVISISVAQVWIYSKLGAAPMTVFSGLLWMVISGRSLYKMSCAIRNRHHHRKEAAGKIARIQAVSNELLDSRPMLIQCSVTCHENSLSVGMTTFNAAAKQMFGMDSPCGIPLSFVLQESSTRFVNSMTRALCKNAASQMPVGGISFASANLHALQFRTARGLFTASATLAVFVDHATGQGVLCLGVDMPKACQQMPGSKEVECNHYVASARMQTCKEPFSSNQEGWGGSTAPTVTWSSCLVETIYFQA